MGKILIVEDEVYIREGLVKIVKNIDEELEVYVTGAAAEALRISETEKIDVFILDIQLEDYSGLILAEQIRKMDIYKLTPIIFVTGDNCNEIKAYRNIHCYTYIFKPFKKEVVIKVFKDVITNGIIEKQPDSKIIIKEKGFNYVIYQEDIIYVEAMNNDLLIKTCYEEFDIKKCSLSKLSKQLDDKKFKLLSEIANKFEYQIDESKVGEFIDFRLVEIDAEGKETFSYISTLQRTNNGFERMVRDDDGDKIPNGYEIWDFGTDPMVDDTDKDGIPDGYEILTLGTDPLIFNNPKEDLDNDGITNIDEYKNGTDPRSKDSDFDGLSDYDELVKYNSNPNKSDSDKDGINDFDEFSNKKKKTYYGFEEVEGFYDITIVHTGDPAILEYTYNYLTNTVGYVRYANNLIINYLYDTNNNPIAIISNENNNINVINYSYEDGKVDSVNTNGNSYFIDYDSKGKVKKINIGNQELVDYSYDGDMLKKINHGNGSSLDYEFNGNNKITSISENGKVKTTWEYDEDD